MNWDQALDQASTGAAPDLTVFVTDGDPTAYDFGTGDPYPAPNVAYATDKGEAPGTTLFKAIDEANVIKNAGTRMLAVGVGAALDNPNSEQRLIDMSGPRWCGTLTGSPASTRSTWPSSASSTTWPSSSGPWCRSCARRR